MRLSTQMLSNVGELFLGRPHVVIHAFVALHVSINEIGVHPRGDASTRCRGRLPYLFGQMDGFGSLPLRGSSHIWMIVIAHGIPKVYCKFACKLMRVPQ